MNLKKEGAAIRALLDEADRLEAEADQKVVQADDRRWEAAERVYDLIAVKKLSTQKDFAATTGMTTGHVSRLVRVWQWWLEQASGDDCGSVERPVFYNAEELTRDATLQKRALSQGKAPSTVAKAERDARTALKNPESAVVIMNDPAIRETTKRAIIAAEATEARTKLLAGAKPVELPAPDNSGYRWLEVSATMNQARKALKAVARMISESGPGTDGDREGLAEDIAEIRLVLDWIETLSNGGDFDDALARLLSEEG